MASPRATTGSQTSGPAGSAGPVSVIVGEEELLVERAVARLVAAAAQQSGAGVREVAASGLAPGELAALATPSLFDAAPVVVVRGAQDAGKDVAGELAGLAAAPPPDVSMVITHAGGAKGKALLASLSRSATEVMECPKVTRIGDRMTFVREEFRAAGRRIDDSGVRALIEAVGSDLREIASACAQLADDTTGTIDQTAVARYYRGRADAGGFAVADKAVEGRLPEALELLRWALAIGVSPVLITSALAQGIRLIGRVGAAPRSQPSAALAAELGAPPWRIDKVRQQLRGWTAQGTARALAAVAEADAQVKGEGTNPGYALEVAIRTIVASRGAR
jgi:DNA polymerase III subunit delta